MSDSKISDLPAVSTPLITDEFGVVDISSNETKKVSLGVVRAKPAYQWNNLPDAADYQWQLAIVNDETSLGTSPVVAYSDGSVWRYAATGTPVAMEAIPSGGLAFSTTAPGVVSDDIFNIKVPPGYMFISKTAPELVNTVLLLNPNFDSDTIWTKQANWTISGGVAVHTSGSGSEIYQTVANPLQYGEPYIVQWELVSRTSGGVRPKLGGDYGTYRYTPGVYTDVLIPTSNELFAMASSVTFSGTVDNILLIKPFGGVVPAASLTLSTTTPSVT